MDPTNKFWWFAGVSIFTTILVFGGIGIFVWQALTLTQQTVILEIVKTHFIYFFTAIIVLLTAVGFALDGIFHSYILPHHRLPEEIELVYTVNPRHRIKREGGKMVNLLIDKLNEWAERHETFEAAVDKRVQSAKAEVEKEKNILAVIMSELPEGVLICNREGQILFYNRQARKFLTRQNEDLFEDDTGTDGQRPLPFAYFGLGRSVFEVIDRNLISHAWDEISEKLSRQSDSTAAYFVVLAADGRHIKAEMVPVLNQQRQFSGFVLILYDISSQMETDGRADLLLRSLSGGLRTSVAGVRAASETMMEFPDIPAETRQEFTRIVYTEALRISQLLGQHSPERIEQPRSQWPLIEMRAGPILEKIAVKARHLLHLRLNSENYENDLQLSADSYSFTLAILFMMHQAHDEFGTQDFRCRVQRQNGYVHFDLVWEGPPLRMETVDLWTEKVLSLKDQGLPLTLGEVIHYHQAEIWPYADNAAPAATGIRLTLPALRSLPQHLPHNLAIIPDSRPEFYDFDLFNQPGQLPEIDNCPLTELTYTVFDTETTGLDPRGGDEIISIGAVRIVNNRLLQNDRFERLVNPKRPLRWESVQIHGIRDEMLADQPTIEEVLPQFFKYAENTIMVAHNAAFDMRMLQIKEAATGLRFINPVLDTMLLSAVVHPAQDNHNLMTIAQRLGIDVTGRHTAIGDALATAEMFLKLLPLLAKKDIRTLQAARQASEKTYYARLKY
ncbi:MAG: exonuclease domain-containing protein [Desulfobacterales bacterium]|nr:exonuclease domain-containing protein [Desulfobacterales bacterium]